MIAACWPLSITPAFLRSASLLWQTPSGHDLTSSFCLIASFTCLKHQMPRPCEVSLTHTHSLTLHSGLRINWHQISTAWLVLWFQTMYWEVDTEFFWTPTGMQNKEFRSLLSPLLFKLWLISHTLAQAANFSSHLMCGWFTTSADMDYLKLKSTQTVVKCKLLCRYIHLHSTYFTFHFVFMLYWSCKFHL